MLVLEGGHYNCMLGGFLLLYTYMVAWLIEVQERVSCYWITVFVSSVAPHFPSVVSSLLQRLKKENHWKLANLSYLAAALKQSWWWWSSYLQGFGLSDVGVDWCIRYAVFDDMVNSVVGLSSHTVCCWTWLLYLPSEHSERGIYCDTWFCLCAVYK